jgi:hypothetical protein
MPYEIEPERELADLSESELYEQVAQLAAEGQLARDIGVLGDDTEFDTEATDDEAYCIDVENRDGPVPLSRVEQAQRELDREKELAQSLQYRRRRRGYDPDSEEDSPGEITSDEERLDLCTQRQMQVVDEKTYQLQRAMAKEAEMEARRRQLLEEKWQRERQLADVKARREHALQVRQRNLLIRQRLDALQVAREAEEKRDAKELKKRVRQRNLLIRQRLDALQAAREGEEKRNAEELRGRRSYTTRVGVGYQRTTQSRVVLGELYIYPKEEEGDIL